MIRHFAFLLICYFFSPQLNAQLIADGLPGCLDPTLFKEGTLFCGGGGSSVFDIVGTEFVVNNVDGIVCCGPPFEGGDNEAYFQFGPLDISAYNNVSVSMSYTADPTGYEDNFPGAPSFGCLGTASDNSHDQILFTYIIDGTPVEDLYVHGTSNLDFTGIWNTGPVINGNSLTIKVFAANKATAEVFRFSNLQVFTSPITIDAGPDETSCTGGDVDLMGTGVGEWSGGVGVFSDVTDPNATYTPDASEDGTTVVLTYTAPPVTSDCGLTISGPSDEMEITVSSPMGTLSGGGNLCPGECATIDVIFTNGQEPYILDLTFSSSVLPTGFSFSIPGFNVNETIQICYAENGIFPSFDLATNTLTLPPIVANTSGTLTLNSLSDDNGCTGVPQNSTIDITFLENPQATEASMEVCNDGNGDGVFDFTTLNTTILNGNGGTVSFYEDFGLNTEIFPPYIGPSTTIYAVVTDANGCESEPVPIDLIVIENGDAGFITVTCMGNLNCPICDSDGIPGEEISIDFTFEDPSINYLVELVYIIDGTQDFLTTSIPGSGGSLTFTIDGNASFQIISVTPDNDCIDVTDLPPAVNFTYIIQPDIFPLGPFIDCDPIALPEINSLNPSGNSFYNTSPDGTGVNYNPGDIISNSITLYAIDGLLPDCADIQEIEITIEGSINLITPPNDTVCGYYIFPDIPGQGTGTTVGYYTELGGTGINYEPGDTLFTTDTIFLFDPQASCPSNEPMFDVFISNSISYDTLLPISSCDFAVLPLITGAGFTDSVRFYDELNGSGLPFLPGDTIFSSDTLYVYDKELDCDQDSVELIIEIGAGITYDNPNSISNCGPYILPQISGDNIGLNAMYFTSVNGGGLGLLPGDTIFNTTTLFVFDTTTLCNVNQPTFDVTINDIVVFDLLSYNVSCGSFTLPPITGENTNGDEGYFTDKFGTGISIPVGTVFMTDTIIYLYSGPDACEVNKEVRIVFEDFNSGMANNYSTCSSQGSINLFDGLLPPYTTGGEWIEQGSNFFDLTDPFNVDIPMSIDQGTYRFAYTLSSPDCPTIQTVSRVEIIVTPNAGLDTMFSTCLGAQEIDLSSLINPNGQTDTYEYIGPGTVQITGSQLDISALDTGSHQILVSTANVSASGTMFCYDTAYINFNITEKPSAGDNIFEESCKNNIIDLSGLLVNNDFIGEFISEEYQSTINGSQFDPSVLDIANIQILHILNTNGECEPDTAVINIDLLDTPFAGEDISSSECSTGDFLLTDYITNGDNGGQFELLNPSSSVSLNNSTLTVDQEGIVNLIYIVSSTTSCGNDTANYELIFASTLSSDFTDNTCNDTYDFDGRIFTPADNSDEIMYTTSSGCDSLVNVEITFNSPSSSLLTPTICAGESIMINGKIYEEGNLVGTDTLSGMAASGCDSIIMVSVTVEQEASSDITINTCNENYSLIIGNDTYNVNNPSGLTRLANMAENGCDSLVNVNLTIEPFNVSFSEMDPECEQDAGILTFTDLEGSNSLSLTIDGIDYFIVDLPYEISLPSGTYLTTLLSDDVDCTQEIEVSINEAIVPEAVINATPLSDSTWQLSVETDTEITTYFWTTLSGSLSCWDCPNPIFTGQGDITVIFDYGTSCTDNTSISLFSEKDNDFFLPNIISGNNDGINDDFQIFVNNDNNIVIESFVILDRWGNKMTNIQNLAPQNGDVLWDGKFNGKEVNPGVYLYIMQVQINGDVKNITGDFTIIR